MAALLGGEQGSRQSGGHLGDALRYNSRGISGPVERLADGRKDRAVVRGRAHTMALALLGAWLGLTLLMWFVAAGSFSTVDRVLRGPSPPLSEAAERIGHERTRMVLRYLASEIKPKCFNVFIGRAQVLTPITATSSIPASSFKKKKPT